MTTKDSPVATLKAQADRIAGILKKAERGERVEAIHPATLRAARLKVSFSVGIVMDDQVITLDIPWATIRETDAAGLSEWIVRQMQGKRADG